MHVVLTRGEAVGGEKTREPERELLGVRSDNQPKLRFLTFRFIFFVQSLRSEFLSSRENHMQLHELVPCMFCGQLSREKRNFVRSTVDPQINKHFF